MPGRQLAALCLVSVACGFITPRPQAAKPTFDPLHLSKKETTWDRLTGPKLFKTVKRTEGIHAVPLVPLRVLTGVLMMHHGSEGGFWPANYGTPGFDGFVDFIVKPYFGFLPGDPQFWSAIHDYVEFWTVPKSNLFGYLLNKPGAQPLFVRHRFWGGALLAVG